MWCEIFNKMGKFVEYVFDGYWSYTTKVELWEIVLMTINFLITLLIMSWWIIPIRFLFKKCGNITFYCKSKKGE